MRGGGRGGRDRGWREREEERERGGGEEGDKQANTLQMYKFILCVGAVVNFGRSSLSIIAMADEALCRDGHYHI